MPMPDKMTARYMRRYGFKADTIIDVGVHQGTPFLYEAFADRRFLLIDPMEESRRAVAARWAHLDYAFHTCALGATYGTLEMTFEPGRLARCSSDGRLDAGDVLERRAVAVEKLDTLTMNIRGRFGLKIDTEGHELDVLHGAVATLRRCEFVIAETSIKKRFAGGYRFSDVIGFMARHGFEVYSFLSGLTRAPRMSDVLFIPADSPRFDMV